MFAALKPFISNAPVVLRIATEGDLLRVLIHQKPEDVKTGVALNLVLTASAEDLDRELPDVLAGAEAKMREAAKPSVTEQAAPQIEAQAKLAADERAAAGVKPIKQKQKPKPPAKKAGKAKAKVKVTHTKPAKPAAAKPAAKKTAASAPKAKAKPVKHIASKPGKEDCIKDYQGYLIAHPGIEVKREAFMAWAPTGRRFERLWGNWNKFIAEASKAGTIGPANDKLTMALDLPPPGGETSAAPQAPCGTPASSPGPSAATDSTNDVSPATLAVSPGESSPAIKPAAAADTPTGRSVVTAVGNITIAAGIELEVEIGMPIKVPGTSDELRVHDFNDKTIWVERITQTATEGAAA